MSPPYKGASRREMLNVVHSCAVHKARRSLRKEFSVSWLLFLFLSVQSASSFIAGQQSVVLPMERGQWDVPFLFHDLLSPRSLNSAGSPIPLLAPRGEGPAPATPGALLWQLFIFAYLLAMRLASLCN